LAVVRDGRRSRDLSVPVVAPRRGPEALESWEADRQHEATMCRSSGLLRTALHADAGMDSASCDPCRAARHIGIPVVLARTVTGAWP